MLRVRLLASGVGPWLKFCGFNANRLNPGEPVIWMGLPVVPAGKPICGPVVSMKIGMVCGTETLPATSSPLTRIMRVPSPLLNGWAFTRLGFWKNTGSLRSMALWTVH